MKMHKITPPPVAPPLAKGRYREGGIEREV